MPAALLIAAGAAVAAYGGALFTGVPLLMGFAAVLFATRRGLEPNRHYFGTALAPLPVCAVLLLLWKIEGAICIAMAAPIALPCAMLGGYIARRVRMNNVAALASCFMLLVPYGVLTGSRDPAPPEFQVSTQMVMNAPPEQVWRFVPAFPQLDERPEWLFRLGIASPVASEIAGPAGLAHHGTAG